MARRYRQRVANITAATAAGLSNASITWDGTALSVGAPINMNSNKITSIGTATAAGDVAALSTVTGTDIFTVNITQSAHGFAVMNAIYHNGSAWAKADASAESTQATAMVTAVAGSDDFTYAVMGTLTLASHGMPMSQFYLSETAGAITTSAPTISQPLLRPVDANTVLINVQRANPAAGGGSDARTIYTRTFQLTQAQIAAKGGVGTADWAMFTLAANEGVRWIWFRTLSNFTGGPNVNVNVGWAANVGGLYASQDMTTAGNYDDNYHHDNAALGNGREMGDAGAEYDATALMGQTKALRVYTSTGGDDHDEVTGGGPLYINVEIVRYDASQLENVT